MARALKLAWRGLYTTSPNPRVGCVIAAAGEVVGEGFHRRAGEPHAEPLALSMAGERARGATAYVTLEPCCHHGRTPPCTDALIGAGVRRVVAAMEDPNPKVAGTGLEKLRAAGILVESGMMESLATELNPGFVKRMALGRPLVRCKLAMSLDGRTAMASGESKWITGEAARNDVHRLRARSGAVVTGINTVAADDPGMNVRLRAAQLPGVESEHYLRQPLRVVLDPSLAMSPRARMLSLPGETLILCSQANEHRRAALRAAGAQVETVNGDAHRLDLGAVLDLLADREINELLLESGPTLAGAALAAGLIDELVIYCAPHIMGDAARGLFRLPGVNQMRERIGLAITDLRRVGRDIRISACPDYSNES
ncbi:MAG: bifunctional diaminohydroxyphosphoribosylaminopyrimidine deaminase/5-amino-6-(5-phosphoribosylamino)uracil reductase RibD [Gammaproteobacteria bacterium]|nr:bifunctional diaminohydroxyphosphoribosylaminopyrimidine deaminase/5-amino-6-(5-phosphoribosylamino)uracil reductase RibD [Gammaproteobacteria bacterium]